MTQQQRAVAKDTGEHGEKPAAYQHILYEVSEKIATITLNRPDRMNAWTPIMERDVRHAMEAAAGDDDVRVIVLTGSGRAFRAGAELLAEGGDFPVQAFQTGHAFGFQFHPDVTYAMMHRWTTRGYDRLEAPGARARHHHFADRAVHDVAERAWLKAFLDDWLTRMPRSVMSEAAE